MANQEAMFGDLRSVLQKQPAKEVWAELVEQLDRWKFDEYFEEVVRPYVEENLADWPEDLDRIAPSHWGKPLLKKKAKPAPLLKFATGIDFTSSRIGPAAMRYLTSAPEFGHMTYLNLSKNGVKSEGAKLLAKSPHLKNLRVLLMEGTKVGNSGAVAMANSKNFQHLVELDLSGSDMIDEGCDALASSKYLSQEIRSKAYDWYSHEREEREYYRNGWE